MEKQAFSLDKLDLLENQSKWQIKVAHKSENGFLLVFSTFFILGYKLGLDIIYLYQKLSKSNKTL